MSSGSSFHQAGARAEKALALVEAKHTSFGPGILNLLVLVERKALPGACAVRRSLRYAGPGPRMALKVNTSTLNLIR